MMRMLVYMGFGIFFGFTLSRVGASDYDLIFSMFALTDLKVAWVIITAIFVANLGMNWLRAQGNIGFRNQSIDIKEKPLTRLTPLGGIIFGIGWAMAGACPGTVLAQIGEGKILGLFTFSGIIAGTFVYAWLVDKGLAE